jgi:hypothetical protein
MACNLRLLMELENCTLRKKGQGFICALKLLLAREREPARCLFDSKIVSRIMLAICVCVQSELGGSSVIERVWNKPADLFSGSNELTLCSLQLCVTSSEMATHCGASSAFNYDGDQE